MARNDRSGQLGNMAPLHGEFEIRQGSTDVDALTIRMSSGASTTFGGAALAIQRPNTAEGSSVGGFPVFRAEYDGTWGLRKVIALSSASTGITLAASQSGAFLIVPDNTAGAQTLTLPAMEAGLWYEIYIDTVGGSGVRVAAATAGTMVVYGDAEANVVNIGGTATATAEGGSLRVITDGTKWYTVMQPAFSSAAAATNTYTLYGIET